MYIRARLKRVFNTGCTFAHDKLDSKAEARESRAARALRRIDSELQWTGSLHCLEQIFPNTQGVYQT